MGCEGVRRLRPRSVYTMSQRSTNVLHVYREGERKGSSEAETKSFTLHMYVHTIYLKRMKCANELLSKWSVHALCQSLRSDKPYLFLITTICALCTEKRSITICYCLYARTTHALTKNGNHSAQGPRRPLST